jgi:hypothetical protein
VFRGDDVSRGWEILAVGAEPAALLSCTPEVIFGLDEPPPLDIDTAGMWDMLPSFQDSWCLPLTLFPGQTLTSLAIRWRVVRYQGNYTTTTELEEKRKPTWKLPEKGRRIINPYYEEEKDARRERERQSRDQLLEK